MSGTLVVSLDFELYWGMQDCISLEDYKENILGGRKAIMQMLKLFEKYGIHATWATVGFLFADSLGELKEYLPETADWPTYEDDKVSTYSYFNNIEKGQEAYYFAPSLIRKISEFEGQEIGSHTFSHYYCREKGQTVEQFEADMRTALEIANTKGYTLTSAVLPRNQCEPEYTEILQKLGFTAYRDEENDWIHEKIRFRPLMRVLRLMDVYLPLTGLGGYVPNCENGIWNFVGSRMYKPIFKPLIFLEKLKIRRIKKQMHYAAKNGLMFHLWWHPHNVGIMTEAHMKQLEEIFQYYQLLKTKYGMKSLNMREAAERKF